MQSLIGTKKSQSQRFLENGARIPVTLIDVKGNIVISHKTEDKDKYQAIQLGFGIKKNATKAEVGHAKGAKLEKAPKFLREVRVIDSSEALPEVGSIINPEEVFAPGDIIDISGVSKGKGYAGAVKRHGFHGGPKTHGQSDRHRAPGSIGQGTTPGRVYKGKRMAGRMGSDNVTVANLKVVDVTSDGVLVVKGLVPGIINSLIYIEKVGEDKNFVPLWKKAEEDPVEENATQVSEVTEEKTEAPAEVEASQGASEEKVEVSEAKPAEEIKEEAPSEVESAGEAKEEVVEDAR